jgi:hypothetical protein
MKHSCTEGKNFQVSTGGVDFVCQPETATVGCLVNVGNRFECRVLVYI